MTQVSVIVLTYNPDRMKLFNTLDVIIMQKGINLEIVVSDDGSSENYFEQIRRYFSRRNFSNFVLVENLKNQGTVRNCLAGVRAASGEYVFLTSPGDIIYDECTMQSFYDFAKPNHVKLCFGNAVYYSVVKEQKVQLQRYSKPDVPQRYNIGTAMDKVKASFFGGNWIIGACYFRERGMAEKYFEMIADLSIYMEDTTSTFFALTDDIPVVYFDRNIVWYEHGTGVSTNASRKWEKLLKKDLCQVLEKLKSMHPEDPYVDFAYCNLFVENRWRRIAIKLLRHLDIMYSVFSMKCHSVPKEITCTNEDVQRLNNILFDQCE